MSELNLPSALEQFLREKRELEYNTADCVVGKVNLEWVEDLELSSAIVDFEESPLANTDPNNEATGHYDVPCVSLLFDCENYYPWGVLCWFPNERQFGTVDSDHCDVFLFGPETGWAEIVKDPVRWLNYQWKERERDYFAPGERYEFLPTDEDEDDYDPAASLADAKSRYEKMKAKYVKRGVTLETEQLSFLRSEIEALESVGELSQAEPILTHQEESADSTSDLGGILEQTLAQLEAAMREAPREQRQALEEKLEQLRARVQALKQDR